MAYLFEPLTLKSITLKNRLVVSPMCQYSSQDGFANDWHLVHLGSRAVGGAALILFEATAVSPEGRITPADLGIYKDEHIEGLQRITRFIEMNGAVPGIQLAHAGRKASHRPPWEGGTPLNTDDGAWTSVAPSAITFKEGTPTPVALDDDGLQKVIEDFRQAASRSLQAGFKIIEIHAAHGYLLHAFYSPLCNERTDAYGGSFQNRIRLLVQVIEAVQAVWPSDLPLFVRISATDWVEGGWSINDSLKLARILKEKGVDVLDCSSGGNVPDAKIPAGPLYQATFAEQIKKATGVPTGAVGIITTAQQAENLIADGSADLVFIARQMLRDPYFALHAAKELGVDVTWPVQYDRAKRH